MLNVSIIIGCITYINITIDYIIHINIVNVNIININMIKMRETASPRHKWRGFKRGGFSTTHF